MDQAAVTVYVDPLMHHGWILRGHVVASCHMVADTEEELHAMAAAIGMRRAWFQPSPPSSCAHYDLTASRRKDAVARGAVELGRRESVNWRRARRGQVPVSELPS